MAALDVVVVATALPTLQTHLGASLADLEWTINAYNLVFGCLMLTGAALGDRFGRRRMYVLGLVVFVLGSAMAALSPGTGTLIAARVVQGAGAAMLVPLTLTLISDAFPAEKRGAAIGIWGGITGLGVAAGPVVGGAIVQGISWQWIFWLNVPVGLAVAALSALRLRESRGPRPQLDFIGMALAGIALFALTWAPVRAPSAGWGSSRGHRLVRGRCRVPGRVPGLGTARPVSDAAPGLLPPARLRHRERGDLLPVHLADRVPVLHHPAVPDRAGLLAARRLACGSWSGWPRPCWSRRSPAHSPTRSATGRSWSPAWSCRPPGWAGWRPWSRQGSGYGTLVAPLIIAGVGVSMCFPTVANAVTSSVPPADVGVAAGTNNALNALGGVFGVAILAAVFAAHGSYASPATFIQGFRPAEWTAAAVAAAGVVAAVLAPSKHQRPAG